MDRASTKKRATASAASAVSAFSAVSAAAAAVHSTLDIRPIASVCGLVIGYFGRILCMSAFTGGVLFREMLVPSSFSSSYFNIYNPNTTSFSNLMPSYNASSYNPMIIFSEQFYQRQGQVSSYDEPYNTHISKSMITGLFIGPVIASFLLSHPVLQFSGRIFSDFDISHEDRGPLSGLSSSRFRDIARLRSMAKEGGPLSGVASSTMLLTVLYIFMATNLIPYPHRSNIGGSSSIISSSNNNSDSNSNNNSDSNGNSNSRGCSNWGDSYDDGEPFLSSSYLLHQSGIAFSSFCMSYLHRDYSNNSSYYDSYNNNHNNYTTRQHSNCEYTNRTYIISGLIQVFILILILILMLILSFLQSISFIYKV